jgi:Domain of unknown function (DUF1833)
VSPRPLSVSALRAITAQETGEIFLILITITHDDLADPLYFVNNTENIMSRGHEFLGWPFELALPDEREDSLPSVQIRIDNVDRRILEGIRGLLTAPTVLLEIVLASVPDVVEAGPITFTLRGVDYDALVISGSLTPEDVLNEPAMQFSFTPALFPGLFP